MKLLLADDHTLFQDALAEYVERAEPTARVERARDMPQVLDILKKGQNFDLVLLDLRMPGMQGLNGLKELRKNYPNIPVALLSGTAEKEDVKKAMSYGAVGYLPKTLTGKDLLKGISKVLAGERYVALDFSKAEIMPAYYDDGPKKRVNQIGMSDAVQEQYEALELTPREKEVLGYLLKGAPNKEIAKDLGVEIVTVKLHVRGVCRKLGAKNRTQAALIARDMGLR